MSRYAIAKGRNMYYAGRLCGDETEEDAAQRLEIMNELDLLRTFKERIMQAALHQSALDWKKELLSDTVASAMPDNVPVSKHRHELRDELSSLINKYYEENESNTPDFILAQYLLDCLDAFNVGVNARTEWYDGLTTL